MTSCYFHSIAGLLAISSTQSAREPKSRSVAIDRFQRSETWWSGGRDSNSWSPGPKPEAKAYRIRLDLIATTRNRRKSLNSSAAKHDMGPRGF